MPQAHAVVRKQPGGKATELPLCTDVLKAGPRVQSVDGLPLSGQACAFTFTHTHTGPGRSSTIKPMSLARATKASTCVGGGQRGGNGVTARCERRTAKGDGAGDYVAVATPVNAAPDGLMKVPCDVGLDGVEAKG